MRALNLGAATLSFVPAPTGHVRYRPGLSVHPPVPSASRIDARRLATLDQHDGNKSRHRADRQRASLVHRHKSLSARASTDRSARGISRRVAVLRTASIRAHGVGG